MSTHYKPNANILREIVPTVDSWRALALKLGMTYPSSAIYKTVRPFCREHGIDYSHFLGQAHNRDKTFPDKRTNIQLYLTNELPIGSHNLKVRLIDEGIKEHRCEVCDRTEWNGKPIPIQLHHKDGNSANNLLDNLQIACPNCHAQTDNYCAKNHTRRTKPREEWVTDEQLLQLIPYSDTIAHVLRQADLSLAQPHYLRVRRLMVENPTVKLRPKTPYRRKSRNPNADPYWRIRPKPDQRKFVRPSKEDLERMIWEKPAAQLAKDLGCSDTLLCAWCRSYDIEKPPRGYWSRRASGETHEQAIKPYVPPVKQVMKRLTDAQVIDILSLLNEGKMTLRAIGEKHNVRHQTVMEIRDGESYKHVRRDGSPTENFARDLALERGES